MSYRSAPRANGRVLSDDAGRIEYAVLYVNGSRTRVAVSVVARRQVHTRINRSPTVFDGRTVDLISDDIGQTVHRPQHRVLTTSDVDT